ncbi:MAG: Na+/H+ antiporter subunit E [Rhodobacteraceae bacterium]|nr:Na+/H+ antiporter subunit E [Paracoccaceae bacterium]
MNIFALNVALAVAWAALTGSITLGALAVGLVLGALCLYVTQSLYPGCDGYFRRLGKWIKLILVFLYDLVVSSIEVVWDIVTPSQKSRPRIIAVPLTVTREIDILLVTNLVSLTPGTLSLDVTPEDNTLYIHAMFADDPDEIRRQIKEGVERRVIEAME